jgi:hypothetical protein
VTPAVPALGEAVQEEGESVAVALAAGGDVEAQAVGLNEIVADLSRTRKRALHGSRLARPGLRQGGEAVGFDLEGHRHQVVIVRESVQPGDLDDLPLIEALAQGFEDLVGNLFAPGDGPGVGEGSALTIREMGALLEVEDVLEPFETELRLDRLGEVEVMTESALARVYFKTAL